MRTRWLAALRRQLASVRVRIVGWHVLLLVAAVALSVVAARTVLHVRLDERIDRELSQEVEELRALAGGTDPDNGEPFGDDVERILEVFMDRNVPMRNEAFVAYLDGEPFREASDQRLPSLDEFDSLTEQWGDVAATERGSRELAEFGTIAYHAVPLRVGDETAGVFLAAWFRDFEAAEIDEVVAIMIGLGLAVLVVGVGVVWNVSNRVLRPVRQLADAAEASTATDMSTRIDVHGADEVSRLSATFNEMLDRLQTAFAAQRQFVDDAGHELRTPITIIRGHLELLEYGTVEDRTATVALVTDELDRMHRMVADLLLLTKAQEPDFLVTEPVELGTLTRELHAKVSRLADRDWRLDGVGDGGLVGDRQRLTQAVLQLATNAVAHTGDGDPIALGSSLAGGQARLWVRDSGPGVQPEDAERIFQRFNRGSAASRHGDGAGLGLAIVEAIVTAHGGRVRLDSTPGDGATFVLELPAAPPRPADATDSTLELTE